jgi:hypothetical protein
VLLCPPPKIIIMHHAKIILAAAKKLTVINHLIMLFGTSAFVLIQNKDLLRFCNRQTSVDHPRVTGLDSPWCMCFSFRIWGIFQMPTTTTMNFDNNNPIVSLYEHLSHLSSCPWIVPQLLLVTVVLILTHSVAVLPSRIQRRCTIAA